jgi:hypothetical protein
MAAAVENRLDLFEAEVIAGRAIAGCIDLSAAGVDELKSPVGRRRPD